MNDLETAQDEYRTALRELRIAVDEERTTRLLLGERQTTTEVKHHAVDDKRQRLLDIARGDIEIIDRMY